MTNSDANDPSTCLIHVCHGEDWARFELSLDGVFTGGKLVDTAPNFSGGIEGRDETTLTYTISNWLAGIMSGARFTFRALQLPRRRVILSRLSGSLQASGMQALANGTCIGVARFSDRDPPSLELEGWRIECEIASPKSVGPDLEGERLASDQLLSHAAKNGDGSREVLIALAFQALIDGGVSDPDVRMFDSAFRGDVESLRAALAAGANVNIRANEVIDRHSKSLLEPPMSEKLAAAFVRLLVPQPPA